MANFGKCKNCWWWNRHNNISGNCYFQSNENNEYITYEDSYCPDYYNRRKGDKEKTLKNWCEEHNFKNFIIYKEDATHI